MSKISIHNYVQEENAETDSDDENVEEDISDYPTEEVSFYIIVYNHNITNITYISIPFRD